MLRFSIAAFLVLFARANCAANDNPTATPKTVTSDSNEAKQKKVVWVDLDCVTKNFSTLRVCYPESIITKCYKLVYCSEFTLNRFNNNFYFHHLKIDLRCSNDTNTTKNPQHPRTFLRGFLLKGFF